MSARDTLAFVNGDVILPDSLVRDGVVVCRGGTMRAVGLRKKVKVPRGANVVDAGGGYVSPGFVDLHVHGGDGADYMDGTTDAVRTANRAHARHGTTTIFPTTTTGTPVQIRAMLESCRTVRDEWTVEDGARIGGVHFYGPYFAADKVGCHRRECRRDPDPREYAATFDLGIVRIATCAAELPGAVAFFRAARRRRYLATCGHSNSSWTEMQSAFDAGMRHVDHFWCAMSSVPSLRERFKTPMQASMEQFVLANAEMSTEVLADGCHLAPELLEFAFRMKGERRLCLVTDSSRALDMPPGDYRFGPNTDGEWFFNNGRVGCVRDDPSTLASSVAGMDRMVRTMLEATSAALPQVIRMASLTPAERAGVARRVGSLEAGKRADVLLLTKRLEVRRVFLNGEELDVSDVDSRPRRSPVGSYKPR